MCSLFIVKEKKMKKFFKWFGVSLGSLLGLVLVVFFIMVLKGGASLNRSFDLPAEQITIPTDAESIARGEHWVKAECVGCHGNDLSGGPFLEFPFGYIDAKNLTPGKGGAGTEFKDPDWVRAIRHGVNPEGHSLLIMPATAFWHFSDEDLGAIIAYLKSLPVVDKETREPQFNLVGKAMMGAGILGKGVLIAQDIQHETRPVFPSALVSIDYGNYIVNVSGCHDCHGPTLSGGKSPDPTSKPSPNLTPGGELSVWKEADFIKAIRTGVTPTGHQLDPKQMPWEHYKNFSDDELKAIFLYLQFLPKLETTVP
jgi:mono/diheme cytochrome c family protein